ncbi:hypothetical protein ACH4TP_03760 [Streptomyces sp. NPDC021012]|uniref:hypothetical protein n=1 Tax=Streptomyces sp. NPDC021012 TaxID=3365107 RepID=UPI0037978AFB
MEWAGEKRPVTVDNSAGTVVIGDGNRVVAGAPPAVRSAYWEQVRRIAPAELVGREEELAELADFCRTGAGYVWWRADAWAGKSALMAWLALAPPPGVRIVPFFITARLGAQNDAVAYVDVVLEQLAELAGEGLPALLTAATREAHLLRLYRTAARACAARGERLVLLVDGLDEDRGVTTGPDAHSIAALLPYDLPVIVAGRLNPPLPADVPGDHPLRDPSIVRILTPSPKARAIRVEAERELKHFLTGGGLPYDLLALVTASGGGLTADDLAELTGDVPYRVRDVLRTGPGRTFAVRGEAYLLAHEELASGAREMLGRRELDRWRAVLHSWAEEWRGRGWPDGTPDYLLHGYVAMLREAGDVERMLACALDERRHERLLTETGGIGGALAEVRAAGEAVLEGGERDGLVATMLRLGFRRSELTRRNGDVPVELAASWAAAGQVDRAVAMVRGEHRTATVGGLCVVAERLLGCGRREEAEALVAEAEGFVLREASRRERDDMTGSLAPLLLATGALDRAEHLIRAVEDTDDRSRLLLALLDALCAAGKYERAVGHARGEQDDDLRVRAVDRVCRALLAAGRADEAEGMLRGVAGDDEELGLALLVDGSRALREAGHEERGVALLDEALRALDAAGGPRSAPHEAVRALIATGEFAYLEQGVGALRPGVGDEYWADELAAAGAWDLARAAVVDASESARSFVLLTVVDGLREAGRLDEAEEVMAEIQPNLAERSRKDLAMAFVQAGRLDRAWALIDGFDGAWRDEPVREYARALCEAGRQDGATVLAEGGGRTGAFAALGIADALLDAGDRTTALDLLASAERVLRTPAPETLADPVVAVAQALAGVPGHEDTARALLDAAERRGADEGSWWFVQALVATGQTERAEGVVWSRGPLERPYLLRGALQALLRAGDHGAVVALFERAGSGDEYETALLLPDAVGGLASAGALEPAVRLVPAEPSPDMSELCALVAEGMARAGRTEEAVEWLGRAMEVRPSFPTSGMPAVARAQLALGRREEAVRLVEWVRSAVDPRYVATWADDIARALVLLGAYEEAVAYAGEVAPPNAADLLLSVARDLVAAGEHGRAATVLAGLHPLGHRCAFAYAELARAHPDPGRARWFAALALHLGNWAAVLDTALHADPGAVPLVVAEAERLLDGLEDQADRVRSDARTSSANASPLP